jgi:hypothetical protein
MSLPYEWLLDFAARWKRFALVVVSVGVLSLALLLSAEFRHVLVLGKTHCLGHCGTVRFAESSAETLIAIQACCADSSKRACPHNAARRTGSAFGVRFPEGVDVGPRLKRQS